MRLQDEPFLIAGGCPAPGQTAQETLQKTLQHLGAGAGRRLLGREDHRMPGALGQCRDEGRARAAWKWLEQNPREGERVPGPRDRREQGTWGLQSCLVALGMPAGNPTAPAARLMAL